ncbi:hypothetical protein Tco_0836400 [Tanacetum coccineum]
MTTLADKSLLSGGDNKPPMLEKHLYDSWKSIMELYMMNRPHGRMILASIEKEAIQADCDIKAINIINQGLPTEIYALVSQHHVAKDLWEKIKLLMQGTSLTKQERECKLYDEFDKFTYKKGESLHEYYLRFTLLLNDMNIYKMPLEQFQVNTKFLNTLPDEWSKFDTGVKLVKDLLTTNKGDDPIDAINHMMLFLTAVVTSRYPTTNNQLRNSSNPRQQAIINNGRVTLQPIQGRQTSFAAGTSRTYTPGASGNNSGKQRTVICYNCKGEDLLAEYVIEIHNKQLCQNSNLSAQQDALILSVIEQLKTQVANCTKINLENKSVNDTLTAELERYKEQVKVMNGRQNGFQNPFYLKKAQQLELKLYVGDIIEKTNPIVIPDSEETLILAEKSRLKMLLKQKDHMMLKKKNSVNSPEPILSSRPTVVEVPKELPKFSMVNTSLKKLKHHLAGFDVVVKEITTPIAITEGLWGFEHTKACFRDEIIPFVKALKDLFNTFNQYLVDELSEVQNVFHQMEQDVEQHHLDFKTFEVKMNQVLNENERLFKQVLSKDILNIIMNSSVNNDYVNVYECEKCLQLKTEL